MIHSLSPEQKVSCAKELSHKEDEPADYKNSCMSFSVCIFVCPSDCSWAKARNFGAKKLTFGHNVARANTSRCFSQFFDIAIQ